MESPDAVQRTSTTSHVVAGQPAPFPLVPLLLLVLALLVAYHLGVVLLSVSLARGAST
ncbi:hypothetical protein ACFV1C_00210 [Streptomyces sp. NPDC059605]|uniref:hypothetical protein n=1 Tax=Streptomyces sp. NPDC059605 TaxID=3346882 RepID=UPI0036C3F8E3